MKKMLIKFRKNQGYLKIKLIDAVKNMTQVLRISRNLIKMIIKSQMGMINIKISKQN